MSETRRTSVDAQLSELEQHSIGLALSDPISLRLDGLVALVEAMGERTNRRELIAAIILGMALDGGVLAEQVHRYRTALVRDALVDHDNAASVVVFRSPSPGPRRRGGSRR